VTIGIGASTLSLPLNSYFLDGILPNDVFVLRGGTSARVSGVRGPGEYPAPGLRLCGAHHPFQCHFLLYSPLVIALYGAGVTRGRPFFISYSP